jgi:hypothetical protein
MPAAQEFRIGFCVTSVVLRHPHNLDRGKSKWKRIKNLGKKHVDDPLTRQNRERTDECDLAVFGVSAASGERARCFLLCSEVLLERIGYR